MDADSPTHRLVVAFVFLGIVAGSCVAAAASLKVLEEHDPVCSIDISQV